MKTTVCAMCALLFAAFCSLGAETILPVDEAAALALKQNLSLERTGIETAGKKREAGNAWNSLVPSLSAGISTSRGTSLTGHIAPAREGWTPEFTFSSALSISPAIVTEILRTRADYEAGLLSYEAAKQELELQVRKSFYHILLLEANAALAERNLVSAQARYEETAAKARVGQTSRLDERSALVDLENLKPARRNAETQLRNALDNFAYILGLETSEGLRLSGSLDMTKPPELAGTKANAAGAKQESYTIASLRKSLSALEAQRKTVWSQSYIPGVRLSWNESITHTNNTWNDSAGSFSATLSIQLDNFLPGSKARTQTAAIDDSLALYRNRITEAIQNQDTEIRQNMRALEQSIESIETMSLNVDLARETYSMWAESYRQGSANLQQLRSAADSLSEAENRLRQEQYNLRAAALDLEKALNVPFGSLWQGQL